MKKFAIAVAIAIVAFGLYWTSHRSESPASFGVVLQDALREDSSIKRMLRLGEAFDSMSVDQIPEAIESINRYGRFLADFEIRMFFEAWARHDPAAAVAHSATMVSVPKREAALAAAIESWARRDPNAARETVDQMLKDEPIMRGTAIHALIEGWVNSGQPGVVEWVRGGPEYHRTLGTTSVVATAARRLEREEFIAWADQHLQGIEDPEFEKQFFRRVTKFLADLYTTRAIDWVGGYATEDYATPSERLRLIVSRGLRHDPDRVLEWAESFGSELYRPEIRSAAGKWFRDDFEAASTFLHNVHDEGKLTAIHDPMIGAYARQLTARPRSDWETSIAWAQKIQDEDDRRKILKRAASSWLQGAPADAERWLSESPMSEEDRSAIREMAARATKDAPKRSGGNPNIDQLLRGQ